MNLVISPQMEQFHLIQNVKDVVKPLNQNNMKKYIYLIPFLFSIPLGIWTISTGYKFYYEALTFYLKYHTHIPGNYNLIMGYGLAVVIQITALNISLVIKNNN